VLLYNSPDKYILCDQVHHWRVHDSFKKQNPYTIHDYSFLVKACSVSKNVNACLNICIDHYNFCVNQEQSKLAQNKMWLHSWLEIRALTISTVSDSDTFQDKLFKFLWDKVKTHIKNWSIEYIIYFQVREAVRTHSTSGFKSKLCSKFNPS
jgi:hypothetical protein